MSTRRTPGSVMRAVERDARQRRQPHRERQVGEREVDVGDARRLAAVPHSTTSVPGRRDVGEQRGLAERIARRAARVGRRRRAGSRSRAVTRGRAPRGRRAARPRSRGRPARPPSWARARESTRPRPGASAKRTVFGIGGSSTVRPKRVCTSSSTSRAWRPRASNIVAITPRTCRRGLVNSRTSAIVSSSCATPRWLSASHCSGHEHLVGRGEPVDREHAERRRAVDEHGVVRLAHGVERACERVLAAGAREQVHLGAGEVDVGGEQPDAARVDDRVVGLHALEQHVVQRGASTARARGRART